MAIPTPKYIMISILLLSCMLAGEAERPDEDLARPPVEAPFAEYDIERLRGEFLHVCAHEVQNRVLAVSPAWLLKFCSNCEQNWD